MTSMYQIVSQTFYLLSCDQRYLFQYFPFGLTQNIMRTYKIYKQHPNYEINKLVNIIVNAINCMQQIKGDHYLLKISTLQGCYYFSLKTKLELLKVSVISDSKLQYFNSSFFIQFLIYIQIHTTTHMVKKSQKNISQQKHMNSQVNSDSKPELQIFKKQQDNHESSSHYQENSESQSSQPIEAAIKTMKFRQKRGTKMKDLLSGKMSKDKFWQDNGKYFGGNLINLQEQDSDDGQDYEQSSSGRDQFDSDFDLTDSYEGKRGRKKGTKVKRSSKKRVQSKAKLQKQKKGEQNSEQKKKEKANKQDQIIISKQSSSKKKQEQDNNPVSQNKKEQQNKAKIKKGRKQRVVKQIIQNQKVKKGKDTFEQIQLKSKKTKKEQKKHRKADKQTEDKEDNQQESDQKQVNKVQQNEKWSIKQQKKSNKSQKHKNSKKDKKQKQISEKVEKHQQKQKKSKKDNQNDHRPLSIKAASLSCMSIQQFQQNIQMGFQ